MALKLINLTSFHTSQTSVGWCDTFSNRSFWSFLKDWKMSCWWLTDRSVCWDTVRTFGEHLCWSDMQSARVGLKLWHHFLSHREALLGNVTAMTSCNGSNMCQVFFSSWSPPLSAWVFCSYTGTLCPIDTPQGCKSETSPGSMPLFLSVSTKS